jgi:23S rRNA (uracil1939-C5)-methyltransferase
VQLAVAGIADDGYGTAEIDGVLVNVLGALDGEEVEAEVVRVAPERVFARVTRVKVASSDRVDAPCRYFLECTGCQWQHVSYSRQLELKRQRVVNEFGRYPALAQAHVAPAAGSPNELGYRNHARFTVAKWPENRGQIGFMNAVSRRFVKVDRCLLMDSRINSVLHRLQDRLTGMSQFSVRAGVNTGSMLVQPRLPDSVDELESGQTHYEEEVAGRRFRVASPSFFQVNTPQLEFMASLVKEMLGLSGKGTLVDAYSGVGVFAVLFAPYVDRVIAIEESASSVADARMNAADLANIEFVQARSEDAMVALDEPIDYLVLDPPRVGCQPEVLEAVIRLRPGRTVIVSCEPSALARDVSRLCEGGFKLVQVQPVDMFPQTRHVEALALLEAPN